MQGEHPHRIWKLIYSQSCFTDVDSLASCPEKRIFYRLISGAAFDMCRRASKTSACGKMLHDNRGWELQGELGTNHRVVQMISSDILLHLI